MSSMIGTIGRKLMSTESEWNPKVMIGRAIVAVLPESVLHRAMKAYYGYLLSHLPEDWRERDAALVSRLVGSGDCVIDIGASIGGYTKLLSKIVGPTGRVFSFEPNPPTYDFLAHNVKKLKLGNVELFDAALSDENGSATMVIPRYRWGSECHYDATLEAKQRRSDCRQVNVPVKTLDSIFRDRPERIRFVKCDVNNHELACLRGARETLQRSKPALLIEILRDPDQAGSDAAQSFELLQRIGYEGYWFDGKSLRRRQPGERSQNYFFFTPEHLNELPASTAA